MSLKTSLRIMVVDDMSVSRALITQALDEIGIANYQTANDGREALGALASSPVHLVISDYNMPGLDGLQLLEALRMNKATQRVGFVLITGRADKDVIEKGQKLAMNNFLKKPFTTEQMKMCIEQVVGRL